MSRFYVGQRVRIKFSRRWPELSGTEGTVSLLMYGCAERKPGTVPVAPDAWGSIICPHGDAYFSPKEENIEPATDSYDVTTWDSCVWRPEHLRAGV